MKIKNMFKLYHNFFENIKISNIILLVLQQKNKNILPIITS